MSRSVRTRTRLAVGLAAALVATSLATSAAGAGAAAGVGPTVTGPVTGGVKGRPFRSLAQPDYDIVGPAGYVEREYFIEGTATAYTSAAPLGSDGRWAVTPVATAPYKTRLVVRRPADADDFNGTVIVEWFNVTAGFDIDPDFAYGHKELLRKGYAWVGVSAQAVSVNGLSGFPPPLSFFNGNGLKSWDPVRYASLSHPGDSFSYDIFSQAGRAMRSRQGVDPLGGLRVKRVIADGESQSASRMVTYVNAVHPVARVYDGFMIHSRSSRSAALAQAPLAPVPTPNPVLIRTDIDVPVLTVQAETDALGLGWLAARQPDTPRVRLWEIAGTAHADQYISDFGAPTGARDLPNFLGFPCDLPYNDGPHHLVFHAALDALNRWVAKGVLPPAAPRLEVNGPPETAVRDALGNIRGGIRTPQVDVPVATLSGVGNTSAAGPFCGLFGVTTPFTADQLAALYPTEKAFSKPFAAATRSAVKAGFLLREDAKALLGKGDDDEDDDED